MLQKEVIDEKLDLKNWLQFQWDSSKDANELKQVAERYEESRVILKMIKSIELLRTPAGLDVAFSHKSSLTLKFMS